MGARTDGAGMLIMREGVVGAASGRGLVRVLCSSMSLSEDSSDEEEEEEEDR